MKGSLAWETFYTCGEWGINQTRKYWNWCCCCRGKTDTDTIFLRLTWTKQEAHTKFNSLFDAKVSNSTYVRLRKERDETKATDGWPDSYHMTHKQQVSSFYFMLITWCLFQKQQKQV